MCNAYLSLPSIIQIYPTRGFGQKDAKKERILGHHTIKIVRNQNSLEGGWALKQHIVQSLHSGVHRENCGL